MPLKELSFCWVLGEFVFLEVFGGFCFLSIPAFSKLVLVFLDFEFPFFAKNLFNSNVASDPKRFVLLLIFVCPDALFSQWDSGVYV